MKRIKEFFLLKDDKFFNLLGSLAECTHGCAQEFENFVMEFDGLDEKGKAERIKALGAFEKEGDRLVRTISEELYRSFITPIDREDIHLLASDLDTIIDMMEEVGKKFVYYRLDSTSTVMKCQASIAKQQMAVIMGAIGGLKASKNIKGEYLKVSELEDKADAIYENAMAKLFDPNNRELAGDPLLVIKLKDVYDELEDITDLNQHLAALVESISIKHA